MRKLIGIALFVCLATFVGTAQETPKPEIFGGYQFTALDPSWHGQGWNGAANMYFTHWLGVTGDFSGAYSQGLSFTTYTGGPVVSMHKGQFSPFAHFLIGGAHASFSGVGNNGMAMMFGGGLDMGHKQFAVRLFQMDWLSTRFDGFTDNNNVRVSTGVLLRF
ncbi:MAG TPA: hypothetical protein VJQ82_01065 [Terriglobales bacterium]|nr:hypothetical protein [Terriglobales bacterium]